MGDVMTAVEGFLRSLTFWEMEAVAGTIAFVLSFILKPIVRIREDREIRMERRNAHSREVRSRSRLKAAPGHLLLLATEFLYPRDIYEQVFLLAVDDMREEHAAALAAGRTRKARWVHIRGVVGIVFAACSVTLGDVLKLVGKAFRGAGG